MKLLEDMFPSEPTKVNIIFGVICGVIFGVFFGAMSSTIGNTVGLQVVLMFASIFVSAPIGFLIGLHTDRVSDALSDEIAHFIEQRVRKYVAQHALNNAPAPPLRAQYFLRFLPIPHKDREVVIGDLDEEYQDLYQCFGQKRADRWYWYQAIASFWPFLKATIKRCIKWGTIGWIVKLLQLGWEYVKHFV